MSSSSDPDCRRRISRQARPRPQIFRGLFLAFGLLGVTPVLAGRVLADGGAPTGPGEPPVARASEPAVPAAGDAPTVATGGALEIGPFSTSGSSLPSGWGPLEFAKIPKHTTYQLEPSERGPVVRAASNASASGLIRKQPIDLRQFPVLTWSWKVANLVEKSDPTQKKGDDYAARIYIAFRYESERVGLYRKAKYKAARALFGDIPYEAINYIWATRAPVGSVFDNPYTGDFVKMIPVESGPAQVGVWREERRNVYEDYKKAFGEEPPLVDGVAIMTDTDNTGESATAFYGDIRFLPAGAAVPPAGPASAPGK